MEEQRTMMSEELIRVRTSMRRAITMMDDAIDWLDHTAATSPTDTIQDQVHGVRIDLCHLRIEARRLMDKWNDADPNGDTATK